MRAVFITTSLNPGGAETALTGLVLDLVRSGAEVLVAALRGTGRLVSLLRERGVAVVTVDARGATDLALAMPRIVGAARSFKPEIVQGWMYHGNLVAAMTTPLCGGQLLWGIRQALGALDREKPATNRLIRLGARFSGRPARIVYNSERARAEHEAIGYSLARGIVIGNGFDTEVLQPDAEARARWRLKLGLAEHTVLVGHLARYHPVKDHETFLRAAAQLRNAEPKLHFLMAGRFVDDMNRELVAAMEQLGLARRVTLLGEIDDVSALLPALDLLCVTSRSEAFPNVLGEAMSCGVLCVSTDVGDAAQIVGDTGQVVPTGNPGRLATAIHAVATLSSDERSRRGNVARCRIVENFSQRAATDRYSRLYTECLQRH